ncbi:hypothetical protein AB0K40_35890 [Nonomuraea bangladeshensis]|uniref:Uncharacterized protein n=1 Tax=Nonomuraea bangladeshensis TaxID=404385 RepID=A0ABV3HEF8_9ACTN
MLPVTEADGGGRCAWATGSRMVGGACPHEHRAGGRQAAILDVVDLDSEEAGTRPAAVVERGGT